MKRALAGPLVLAAALGLAPGDARGAPPGAPASPSAPAPAPSPVTVEVTPVLGSGPAIGTGWSELLVRVRNDGTAPVKGRVEVAAAELRKDGAGFHARGPFTVAAGASVSLRVPVDAAPYGAVEIDAYDDGGRLLGTSQIPSAELAGPVLVDVSETSRVRAVLNEVPVGTLYARAGGAPMPGKHGTTASPTVIVATPRFDPATGDPVLPDRAALYAPADAVLLRSDTLARLVGPDLDALAGFVLGGGTLAVVIVRPEDLRHPTVTALTGGPVTAASASSITLQELILPIPPGTPGGTSRPVPAARNPADGTAVGGFAGGNLHGSRYGSTAAYGLGEVHLLAFDPTRKPAVDDPWVQVRMVDLARRAYDRRSTLIFRSGDAPATLDYEKVRKQLDPNEGSRWAIGVAALLLCLYAVLAGPLSFSLAARRGTPLRALRWLPILSALAFATIVGLGVAVKGIHGRARHLTLVEAGGGMARGTARRFRGFYASRAKELTVHTSDTESLVSMAVAAEGGRRELLVVDRDGARLTDVAALPWQTVVVREDGMSALGEGITLAPDGKGAVIVNRSGRDLRGAILRLPSGELSYYPRIKDGERAPSSAASFSARPAGRVWAMELGTTVRLGVIAGHHLRADLLTEVLDPDAPGLAAAWGAVEEAGGDDVDWFPDDVPVLIGQLDGGEGRSSDSGLRLESDRLLVRIVGYGGRP